MSVKNSNSLTSRVMSEIMADCRVIASEQAPVVILGEHGSGKCWTAKMIHERSNRKDRIFSRVNCYSMKEDEIEKRLFGYLSINGDRYVQIKSGLIESCDGGTLYIEGFEVLSKKLQHKIINTVDSRSAKHVGSSPKVNTNVRLIVSSSETASQNNENFVRNETSIFEINPYIIYMPPLRNHREDIASLIRLFLDKYSVCENCNSAIKTEISPEALYACIQYHWPGNIRQLENAIRLAVLLSAGQTLMPEHLPESVRNNRLSKNGITRAQENESFQEAEKNLLRELLFHNSYSSEMIAARFYISPQKLEEKIRRYRLNHNSHRSMKKERN